MLPIDDDETEILDAFEKGELQSVATKAQLAEYKAAAGITGMKDKREPKQLVEQQSIATGNTASNPD